MTKCLLCESMLTVLDEAAINALHKGLQDRAATMQGDDDGDPGPELVEPPEGSSLAVRLCYFLAGVNLINVWYNICGVISDPSAKITCRTNAYVGYLEVIKDCTEA